MDLETRLQKLKDLRDKKLIEEEEYQERRRLILDQLSGIDVSSQPSPSDPDEWLKDFTPAGADTWVNQLVPGLEIGPDDMRFRLEKEIGGGGMGRVWLARDLAAEQLEQGVWYKALKVVHPDLQHSEQHLELLKREALRAQRLSHPNIVSVYGYRQGRDGWVFVEMEYLQGRNLGGVLVAQGGPGLGWERMLELLRSMAAGLAYAHGEGLIHRDLKPGNVFVTDKGQVKLLDFGLAYRLHRSSSVVSGVSETTGGTLEYMPPEGFYPGVTPDVRYDVYGLACLVYELLVGAPPYDKEKACSRPEKDYPPRPAGMSEAVWAVLRAGFSYHKEARPESVEVLAARLEQAHEQPSPAIASVKPPEARPASAEKPVVRKKPPVEEKPVATKKKEPPAKLGAGGKPFSKVVGGILTVLVLIIGGGYLSGWWSEPELKPEKPVNWKPGDVFSDPLKDGGEGPKMVVIPAGTFQMGDSQGIGRDDEKPVHEVRITKDFAIGVYEVTFDDYDRFAEATGRKKPDDEGWGRGRRPVINVNWDDAVAYAQWLSAQTVETYRLPTEAQWEYAARAGSQAAYSFEDDESRLGDYAWYSGNSGGKTQPVGGKKPNGWGLYDVHGNVWEWVQDWYGKYSSDPAEDPQGPATGSGRVFRGGGWVRDARRCRSAFRVGVRPGYRYGYLGFRLSRLL